jgi:hypothetical protein
LAAAPWTAPPGDAQPIAAALHPVGLLERLADAGERKDVGHQPLAREALDIAAQEGPGLGQRPR